MAAFRRLGSASASLVVLRIMAGTPAQTSVLFLPDPGAQDLHRNVRFLGDLLPQVFGKDFGLLGDDRREFERTQRLGIHLSLQRIALGKLGFHLAFGHARRRQCRRGTGGATSLQGRRTGRGGGGQLVPPFAAEQEGHNGQDQQSRQGAATDQQRLFVQRKGECQAAGRPRFIGSSRNWVSSRGLQQKSGFKGQGFNHQLVAAFRRESCDAGHQIVNHFQFFRRRRDQDAFEAVFVFFPGAILAHQYRQRHFAKYARRQMSLFDGSAGLIGDVFRGAGSLVGPAVGTGGGPRKGGSGPRDAVGNRPPCAVFGTQRSKHDAACGVEDLLAQLRARKIALHRHADAEFLGPEEWTEGGADLGDQVGFNLVPIVQRRGGRLCAVQRGRGLGAAQQIAVHVQQGNRVGRQTFHRTGHQVGDGDHVLRGEAGTRPDLDQYAGFGGLLGLKKYGFLGGGRSEERRVGKEGRS